ncbi:hypothetical protein [uncultured Chryseobacterium sp.]|uniref:hypothetical protein n=1 Tax=uncultured Chryseobacterium sp. TaxID=259322 RepID=UPI00258B0EAF|nr:hypothetical protein [uncultured Chryseobacterium sp.]
MKKLQIIFTAVLICFISLSFKQVTSVDFSGKWKTEEGQLIIISKTQTGYTGTTADNKNVILKDIKNVDGKWKGTIQNPVKKTSAPCELNLKDKKLQITAKKGVMSKTFVWTRL